VRGDDLAIIHSPIAFLGVNYYAPSVAAGVNDPDNQPTGESSDDPLAATGPSPWPGTTQAYAQPLEGLPRTAMGWPIEPRGLSDVLTRIAREYTDIPLYVTENGAAFDDVVGTTGEIDDAERIRYLQGHIGAVGDAIATGVDVRGYFVWSLMDNFEWAFGYSRRFGLVYVDYGTLARVPKASARWYRSVILANGLASSSGAGADWRG
jgi:beta-glucosidase